MKENLHVNIKLKSPKKVNKQGKIFKLYAPLMFTFSQFKCENASSRLPIELLIGFRATITTLPNINLHD